MLLLTLRVGRDIISSLTRSCRLLSLIYRVNLTSVEYSQVNKYNKYAALMIHLDKSYTMNGLHRLYFRQMSL